MTGELIVKPVTDATEPVAKAMGGTLADFWQGVLGDRVAAWRIRNAASVDQKLRADLASKGLELDTANLPEGMAFRWFQRATEADEPEIQDLFAKLLANAANGNEDALRKRNIDLVSNLTPDDARLVEFIAESYREFINNPRTRGDTHSTKYNWDFTRRYSAAGFNSELPLDSLLSLGILRMDRDFKVDGSAIGRAISAVVSERSRGTGLGIEDMFDQEDSLTLTELGRSLLTALFPSHMVRREELK